MVGHRWLLIIMVGGIALLEAASAASAAPPRPRFALEVEAGPVWQSNNDVRIPNDETGTRFSLVDVVGTGSWLASRVYLSWNFSETRSLRVLYAPLSITEAGELSGLVSFAGEDFTAGPVEATYKFNSYRLSYRQRFHDGTRWSWWWGLTAKVRDARIALEQDGQVAAKDDIGFVPLFQLAGECRLPEGWRALLDVDALAGGPGRAEDVSLKFSRDLGERTRLAAGYRMVEGGADVDAVYAFAWLHYMVVSAQYSF